MTSLPAPASPHSFHGCYRAAPGLLPSAEPPCRQRHRLPVIPARCLVKQPIKTGGFDEIEHGADVIVAGDGRHAEQRLAVGATLPGAHAELTLMSQKRRALHEERRKAAIPISAIDRRMFAPRRLSAKPAQVRRTNPSKSVRTVTRSLNSETRPSRKPSAIKSRPMAKMRIAGKTLAEFSADWRLSYIVQRAIEIISEAARRIPHPIRPRGQNSRGGKSWELATFCDTNIRACPTRSSGASSSTNRRD